MQRLIIRLCLDKEKVLSHYRGLASRVVTRSLDGRTVQFPASLLRQFVSEDGVNGFFEIRFDDQNRLISMRRYDPSADLDTMA